MQAAFVDIGLEKAAFLYVDDVFVHSEIWEAEEGEPEQAGAGGSEGPGDGAPRIIPVAGAAEGGAEGAPAPSHSQEAGALAGEEAAHSGGAHGVSPAAPHVDDAEAAQWESEVRSETDGEEDEEESGEGHDHDDDEEDDEDDDDDQGPVGMGPPPGEGDGDGGNHEGRGDGGGAPAPPEGTVEGRNPPATGEGTETQDPGKDPKDKDPKDKRRGPGGEGGRKEAPPPWTPGRAFRMRRDREEAMAPNSLASRAHRSCGR